MPCGSASLGEAMARSGMKDDIEQLKAEIAALKETPNTTKPITGKEDDMPCHDSRNTYEYGRAEVKGELDLVTRYLCAILTHTEKVNNPAITKNVCILAAVDADGVDPLEIFEWWEEHKKLDAQRNQSPA